MTYPWPGPPSLTSYSALFRLDRKMDNCYDPRLQGGASRHIRSIFACVLLDLAYPAKGGTGLARHIPVNQPLDGLGGALEVME